MNATQIPVIDTHKKAVAAHIINTAVDHLATKYGCTVQAVVAALAARNVKVCSDFAELTALGVQAMA